MFQSTIDGIKNILVKSWKLVFSCVFIYLLYKNNFNLSPVELNYLAENLLLENSENINTNDTAAIENVIDDLAKNKKRINEVKVLIVATFIFIVVISLFRN